MSFYFLLPEIFLPGGHAAPDVPLLLVFVQNLPHLGVQGKGIYLLEHIQCPGALIECGFLSNPREEALLRDSAYQKKLCCVIGSALNRYLSQ